MTVAQAAPPRPRASGGRMFIVIGVVLALVGFGLAVFLGNLGGGHAPGTVGGPSTYAVFAAKNIDYRTQLVDPGQIQIKAVPDGLKTSDWFTLDPALNTDAKRADAGFKAVQNLIAEVNIQAGSPLLRSELAKEGDTLTTQQAAYLPIAPGYVAFTMPTSEQQGVAGYIQPGDYISVLGTMGSGKTSSTVTVFPNLRVLRVGPANLTVQGANSQAAGNQQQSTTAPNASSITVVVTPCQAEQLIWFQNNAVLKYELESYKDYQPAPTGPDPACANVTAAHGIQAQDILNKFPQFAKAVNGQ